MKKTIIILAVLVFVILTAMIGRYVFKKYIFDIEKLYNAKVVDARWSVVLLDNGEKVSLVGVMIPWNKNMINYSKEMEDVSGKILNGKDVMVELIERQRTGAYHKYDLVRIYMEDGTCVNTYLLENGLAFFSHGYYRGKEKDFESEAKAKREGKGIWANKDDLQLLYVGSKQWEGVHYPECPEVMKIDAEDRMEYYNRMPKIHWYRDWYPEGCPYCDEIRKTKSEHLK